MARAKWLSVCMLWTVACGEPEILGESHCNVNSVSCSGVPILQAPILGEQGTYVEAKGPIELVPTAPSPATWTVPLSPRSEPFPTDLPVTMIEPAPEGGTWVVQFRDAARHLLRLDAAGQEIAVFPLPPSLSTDNLYGELSVSPSLQPVIEWQHFQIDDAKNGRTVNGAHRLVDGKSLTLVESATELSPSRTIAGPEDTVRVVRISQGTQLNVQEFDAYGESNWTRAVPYSANYFESARTLLAPALVRTKDGSTLLFTAARDLPGLLSSTGRLLTMIDAEGRLKWHMSFGGNGPAPQLAALETGGFAVAVADSRGFWIYTLDENGKLLGSWLAEQTGFYGSMPDALASDAEGNLYFSVTTGLRRSPQILICKLRAYDDSVQPMCLPLEGASGGAVQVNDLAAPEPNAVVVAYGTAAGDADAPPRTWQLSRLDF